MTTEERELQLRDYVRVVRRRRWSVILVVALCVAVVLGIDALQTPHYRASAEVLLRTRVSERIFSPDEPETIRNPSAVDTEIAVMSSRSVEDAVAAELGFEPDVSIAARGDTDVVTISATRPDPVEAAAIANTYADVYVEARRDGLVADLLAAIDRVQPQLNEIDQQVLELDAAVTAISERIGAAGSVAEADRLEGERDALLRSQEQQRAMLASRRLSYIGQIDQLQLASELTQTGGAQIVSQAEAPTSPVSPRPKRDAAVAVVIGLLAGIGLAFAREHFDDRIRGKEALDRASGGLPILAHVPIHPGWKNTAVPVVATATAPRSATAEAYRTLRTSLQFIGLDRPTQILQLTSADSGDGKTTTLANLAVALSRAGKRVVMVDCDLRRPRLHTFFGLDNAVGFTAVLVGDVSLTEALVRVDEHANLVLLPSGPPPPNPSELLSANRTTEILRVLAHESDYVLVDSPPVLPVTDGLVLAGIVDTTVVVVAANDTTTGELSRTFELLRQVHAPVVGLVLNRVDATDAYYDYSPQTYMYAERNRRFRRRRAPALTEPRPTGRDRAPVGTAASPER